MFNHSSPIIRIMKKKSKIKRTMMFKVEFLKFGNDWTIELECFLMFSFVRIRMATS